MKASCWIVMTRRGLKRMNTKYLPPLDAGEYAVRLNITVPEVYFDRATPQVNITLSEKSIVRAPPLEILSEPAPES